MNKECAICLDCDTELFITLNCGHSFHKSCIIKMTNFNCPLCRTKINLKSVFNISESEICIDDEYHFGYGYAPFIKDGPCRFCLKKPLNILIKNYKTYFNPASPDFIDKIL